MWNAVPYVLARLGLITLRDWIEKYEHDSAKGDVVGKHIQQFPEHLRAQKAREYIRDYPETIETDALEHLEAQRAVKDAYVRHWLVYPVWALFMFATLIMAFANWGNIRDVVLGIVRP